MKYFSRFWLKNASLQRPLVFPICVGQNQQNLNRPWPNNNRCQTNSSGGSNVSEGMASEKKSTKQLIWSALLLKLCSYNFIVANGEKVRSFIFQKYINGGNIFVFKILDLSHKIFGKAFTNKLLKATFYDQFCIGASTEEIIKNCDVIRKENMFPLLCITAEEKTNPSSYKFG